MCHQPAFAALSDSLHWALHGQLQGGSTLAELLDAVSCREPQRYCRRGTEHLEFVLQDVRDIQWCDGGLVC